jgi:pimeloyl-ACP methyl ester carboxylesterase
MRSQEVRALGELASDALGGAAARIEEMHEGIAQRVFDSVGQTAAPVRLIHNGIAHGVHTGLRAAVGAAVRTGARVISLTRPPEAPSIEQATIGRLAIGALNGAFGDRLERELSPFAVQMTVRRGGGAVDVSSADAIREAFPDATARLAVFVHGLCETEDAWSRGAPTHVPYGPRLRVELGYTPVYVRYNSGRHISDNGRDLAQLLDQLTSAWPTQPEEIALIGHSMGGLIARSACHQGRDPWVNAVRHVFVLSGPQLGAPLERAAHTASAAFARLPETRSLATALNVRSSGVKELRLAGQIATEIPFLECANHYFLSAGISRNPDSLASRFLGALPVAGPSAWAQAGRGRRLTFPIDHYRHVDGVQHFQLTNHPAVYEQIRRWLSGRPAIGPPPLQLRAGPAEA